MAAILLLGEMGLPPALERRSILTLPRAEHNLRTSRRAESKSMRKAYSGSPDPGAPQRMRVASLGGAEKPAQEQSASDRKAKKIQAQYNGVLFTNGPIALDSPFESARIPQNIKPARHQNLAAWDIDAKGEYGSSLIRAHLDYSMPSSSSSFISSARALRDSFCSDSFSFLTSSKEIFRRLPTF